MDFAARTVTLLRDVLVSPFYMSVTWLLNKILGSFSLYVGIEHKEMPPEPDCSLCEDWIIFMALAVFVLYSWALTIVIVDAIFITLRERRAGATVVLKVKKKRKKK